MNGLSQLTPYIHRLAVPFLDIYTSIFLIRTPEGTVVFDTATYPSDMDRYLLPALERLQIPSRDVNCVVISHSHRDHAGGLARFTELFPHALICAGSDACAKAVPGIRVRCLTDGQVLCGPLTAVAIPGHTRDCIGIMDSRTGSLLSGDGLQAWGIYGSGKWGANIKFPTEHLAALEKLRGLDLQGLYTAHDYHPCGNEALGAAAIGNYLDQCALALYAIRDYLKGHPGLGSEEAAKGYNEASGLPTVGEKVFEAMQAAMEKGAV